MVKKPKYENVKLPKSSVSKVRDNKKVTGVSITAFMCQAIDEKLSDAKSDELVESLKEILDELNKAENKNTLQRIFPIIFRAQERLIKVKKPKGI